MIDFEEHLFATSGMSLEEFEKEALEGLKELHKQRECLNISYKKAKEMLKQNKSSCPRGNQ